MATSKANAMKNGGGNNEVLVEAKKQSNTLLVSFVTTLSLLRLGAIPRRCVRETFRCRAALAS